MRKRSNKDLCPRYPGRQWKQMFTFKGNKFDMETILPRDGSSAVFKIALGKGRGKKGKKQIITTRGIRIWY